MRVSGWRRGLVVSLFAFVFALSVGASARADVISSTFSPIIVVGVDTGNVTIRTWDRPAVEIDADPTIQYNHASDTAAVQRRFVEEPYQPELWAQNIDTPSGPLSLPAEPFPLPPLSPGPHDAVSVRGDGSVTLIVPASTALVVTNVKEGTLDMDGYHGGAFVVHVIHGSVEFNGVGGTGAVQVNNGPFHATNSQFDRLRVRTGRGNMVFENCASTQIQASSLTGTIVYDNGTFAPGLAHFESQRGSVAVGVADGNAQVTAHSDAGHVAGEDDAYLRTGPVVTATSGTGNVLYYRGTIQTHPNLMRQLPPAARPFRRPPRPPGRPPA